VLYIETKKLIHAICYYGNQFGMWIFSKDFNEILNFKFTSKFVLIHENIASLQIQILLCWLNKIIWNINNKNIIC